MNNGKRRELEKIVEAGYGTYGPETVNAAISILTRLNKPLNSDNKTKKAKGRTPVYFSNVVKVRQPRYNSAINLQNPNIYVIGRKLNTTRTSGLKSKGLTNFQTPLPPNEKESLRKAMDPNFSKEYVNRILINGSYTYNDEEAELTAEELARRMLEEAGEEGEV